MLNPLLKGNKLKIAISQWRVAHLAKGALILQELREQERRSDVFVEIVHTDGPISNGRKRALLELASESNLTEEECAFVTVFASRSDPAYRKVQGSIAWGSFVWFADEPERIIHLIDCGGAKRYLNDIL